jgi:Sec-independent protein translocase protein TatA
MEILGIGLPELFFIVLIVLVLINPKDMRETGLTIGRWLNRFVHSPTWKTMRDIQNMPNQLMREANLEDLQKDLGTLSNPNTHRPRRGSYVRPSTPQGPAAVPAINVEAQGYSQNLAEPAKPQDTPPETPAS